MEKSDEPIHNTTNTLDNILALHFLKSWPSLLRNFQFKTKDAINFLKTHDESLIQRLVIDLSQRCEKIRKLFNVDIRSLSYLLV